MSLLGRRFPSRAARTFHPAFELLEDRTLLSAGMLDPTFGVGGELTVHWQPGDSSAIGAVADDAILLLTLFAGSGFVFLLAGLARRRSLSYTHSGILAFGNFTIGVFSLFLSFAESIGYQDDLATCGGFPPGYWTTGNVTVNRCSIFVSLHQDWVSDIYLLILLTSAIAFCAVILTRLRQAHREAQAQESGLESIVA